MSDYTIPGYEVLGDVDISTRDYDSEGVVLLLWDKETGLGILWATGCTCCGDMYDGLVPGNARIVEDLEATARELHEAVVNSDEPDVPRLRAMLILAIERSGYSKTMPELG
jgi:hypothetical protein